MTASRRSRYGVDRHGDHYTIRLNGQSHRDPYMFKLDAGRKQIDVTHHDTPPGTYGGKLKGFTKLAAIP